MHYFTLYLTMYSVYNPSPPPPPTPRLFDLYMYMNRLMVQANQQAKLFYHTGDRESLIGWVRHMGGGGVDG